MNTSTGMFKKFDYVQTLKTYFPKRLSMAASDLIHKKEFSEEA